MKCCNVIDTKKFKTAGWHEHCKCPDQECNLQEQPKTDNTVALKTRQCLISRLPSLKNCCANKLKQSSQLTPEIPVFVRSPQQRHFSLPTGRRRRCPCRLCVVCVNQICPQTPPHSWVALTSALSLCITQRMRSLTVHNCSVQLIQCKKVFIYLLIVGTSEFCAKTLQILHAIFANSAKHFNPFFSMVQLSVTPAYYPGARFTKNLTMCHMIVVKSSQICRKSIINHQVTTSHDNVMIVVS